MVKPTWAYFFFLRDKGGDETESDELIQEKRFPLFSHSPFFLRTFRIR